jgi:hypothetical protein
MQLMCREEQYHIEWPWEGQGQRSTEQKPPTSFFPKVRETSPANYLAFARSMAVCDTAESDNSIGPATMRTGVFRAASSNSCCFYSISAAPLRTRTREHGSLRERAGQTSWMGNSGYRCHHWHRPIGQRHAKRLKEAKNPKTSLLDARG